MNYSPLMTDAYELTMLDAWVRDGKADTPAVFEVFARRLALGHRYGVVAGMGRIADALKEFTFNMDSPELVVMLDSLGISQETQTYLRAYRFTGSINAYHEGDLYFPNSPILQVDGKLADVVLETLILSILNADCAIAAKASRMVSESHVGDGRPIIEMGSRRTDPHAALATARAAYIAGFAATSNVLAGITYSIPVRGTAAHAFTLSYGSSSETELIAFRAQVEAQSSDTTLLVDTYDIEQGIRNAVLAAGPRLGGIRIDSGDLAQGARLARELLDSLGALNTKIIVTSDLDEYVMKDLREAPIDVYGVGTKLVSTPPAGMVFKLVEVDGMPVEKKSKDKVSLGGKKKAYRLYNPATGYVTGEYISTRSAGSGSDDATRSGMENLLVPLDEATHYGNIEDARAFHASAFNSLPYSERRVWVNAEGSFLTAVQVESN